MIHPQDQEEYQEKMNRWLKGMDLDSELGSRIRGKNGIYSMFTFHAKAICDENHNPEYLVIIIKNENHCFSCFNYLKLFFCIIFKKSC